MRKMKEHIFIDGVECKQCSKCNKILPLEMYYKSGASKDGVRTYCKECTEKQKKKYKENNFEKVMKYNEQYREKNRGILAKKSYQYFKDNPKKWSQIQQKSYEKNKIKRLEENKIYYKNNKEEFRIRWQKRKSRKVLLLNTLTKEQWSYIKAEFNNRCAYCGEETSLEQEHFVPISKGGTYTINNIIPACKSCNCSKHDKSFKDWYRQYKYYNIEREKHILNHLNDINNRQQVASTI